MKLIFLDIDGVLNCHDWDEPAQSNRIRYHLVRELNRVVEKTGAKIVLSSAWRYMVHGKAMTTLGFEYMLRTHGGCGLKILGCTEADEVCARVQCGYDHRRRKFKKHAGISDQGEYFCIKCKGKITRGNQIRKWIQCNKFRGQYVVIDDIDLDISRLHPLVKTHPHRGLTRYKANEAISMLNGDVAGMI